MTPAGESATYRCQASTQSTTKYPKRLGHIYTRFYDALAAVQSCGTSPIVFKRDHTDAFGLIPVHPNNCWLPRSVSNGSK